MSKAVLRNFIIRPENGQPKFRSPHHLAQFRQFLNQFEGKDVYLTVDPKIPQRTNRQNSYYWLYLNVISDETGHTPEELHSYFKNEFLTKNQREVFGKKVVMDVSTTNLTKTEFGEYIEKISERTGIPCPDAELFQLAPLK